MGFWKIKDNKVNNVTIIGDGTTVSGIIETDLFLRLEGSVKGDIFSRTKVIVAESGFIHGNIHAETVIIYGKVTGNIYAVEMCNLISGGTLEGDMHAKTCNIEENSHFKGHCNILSDSNGKDERIDQLVQTSRPPLNGNQNVLHTPGSPLLETSSILQEKMKNIKSF